MRPNSFSGRALCQIQRPLPRRELPQGKSKLSHIINYSVFRKGNLERPGQTRHRKGLSTTLSASCDLFPGFHSALSVQIAANSAQCCLVPREFSHHLRGLSASQSYPGLPAQAAGSRLPTASLTPCSSTALAQPPKASLPELNSALPRQQSPLPWCRLCLLQDRHTTANRSTKQTNVVSCRNAKLLHYYKLGCELARVSPRSWLTLAKGKYQRQDTRDAEALH